VTTPLTVDADRLSTGESAGLGGAGVEGPADGGKVARHMTLNDVTAECIRRHFTLCITTRSARMAALKL
jgi:hypothetical protein